MNTKADINERGLCHQCGYGVLESADPRIGDWSCERCGTPVYVGDQMTHAAADHALRGLTAERDAAIARAEAAEAQVERLRDALEDLLSDEGKAACSGLADASANLGADDSPWAPFVSAAVSLLYLTRSNTRAALEPSHD